jgi:demethylmenaquinone methyltransferase/2-methoxy-6-polyprenyl-1,4-benzoquinol methylase
MFDAIASRYDTLNRILSLGIDQRWRRRTVSALGLRGGEEVLDVATGTGDLALLVARAAPGVRVVGLDPSPGMLAVAERKIARAGLSVTNVVGDAQSMPFEHARFDAACMAFGIRNVPDRSAALRELARVVRPGGTVAILELSDPRGGVLAPLARWHVHSVVPALGAMLSGRREYRYLERSVAAFPQPDVFAEQMRDAGLEVTRVEPMTFGVSCLFVATPRPRP